MKKIQKKRKGFTLIELVVVIVIIAILAAVALLRFGAFTDTAKDSRIKSEHAQLITAGNMWRAAQDDPTTVPGSLGDIMKYMESSKPLLGQTTTEGAVTSPYHALAGGILTSTLTVKGSGETAAAPVLTYDFAATASTP